MRSRDRVPARRMIVSMGTFIQMLAIMIPIIPVGWSTNQALGSVRSPKERPALFTRPTVALKNQANWKPTRTGANIIGIISSVRMIPCPREISAINCDNASAMKKLRLTVTVRKMIVLPSGLTTSV